MISTDLGNLDVGIQSEPTAGVPNDILIKALEQDMRDKLEVCKLGCGDCPRGLNCQTLGNPDRTRGKKVVFGDGSGFPSYNIPNSKPSSHLEALSYIEHCHRPLGLASRVGINLFVKQEYMWGTPLVPIRVKLRVMGNMMGRLEEELRRGHVAAERDLDSMSSACFEAIDAMKETAAGRPESRLSQPFTNALVKKLFRENCSQPAIAHAFRACCCRLPELVGSVGNGGLLSDWGNAGWATYWAFASDCREAGLGMMRETVVSVHDSRIVTVPAEELQRQIGELTKELRK